MENFRNGQGSRSGQLCDVHFSLQELSVTGSPAAADLLFVTEVSDRLSALPLFVQGVPRGAVAAAKPGTTRLLSTQRQGVPAVWHAS
jgi:hypothetical protein